MSRKELEVLTFDVAGAWFGVRSSCVVEVLRAVALSTIPQAPTVLEGIFNLRGRILPVIDVRKLLEVQAAPLRHTDHLLVLHTGTRSAAIRVDRAIGLLALSLDSTEPTHKGTNQRLVELIAKTSDGLVRIIDPSQLITEPQIGSLVDELQSSAATEFTL